MFDEIPECQLRNVLKRFFSDMRDKLFEEDEGDSAEAMTEHFISILDRLNPVLKRQVSICRHPRYAMCGTDAARDGASVAIL